MSDLPVMQFESPDQFRKWLHTNHAKSTGIWLRFFKKASGKKTFAYAQALDEALCYGWIDGQARPGDADSYLQRFTPRRAKSKWSKRNRDHVARLEKEGRMKPAGLREVERAKADGRWDAAYDSPSSMTLPADFVAELGKKKYAKAKKFLESLPKANKYMIAYRLQDAKKPETRAKRMAEYLERLSRGEPLVVRS